MKTDRVDLEKLLRMLVRFHVGDQGVWSVVRVHGAGVEDRVNFQRMYDVKERVLPEWVDTTPPPAEEARRIFMELSVLFRRGKPIGWVRGPYRGDRMIMVFTQEIYHSTTNVTVFDSSCPFHASRPFSGST